MERILVPLDGSPEAEAALPVARALALAHGAGLFLARAVMEGPGCAGSEAEAYLARIAGSLATAGHPAAGAAPGPRVPAVDAHGVLLGPAANAILELAASLPADLIVIGTRGAGAHPDPGAPRTGSVTEEVIRCASAPVLAIPPAGPEGPEGHRAAGRVDLLDHVLVPLDGSACAAAILPRLAEVAGPKRRCRATLLRVTGENEGGAEREARRELEGIAGRIRAFGIDATVRIERGRPASTIAKVAREAGASMIAMATHGCRGPWRFLLGTVTAETLALATVPILAVHARSPATAPVAGDRALAGAGPGQASGWNG